MAINYQQTANYLLEMVEKSSVTELTRRLSPKKDPLPRRMPGHEHISEEAVEQRWDLLPADATIRDQLLEPHTSGQIQAYQHNIENFIGTVKLAVGIAGPLRVNGLFAQGDYYVPLATSEASLVASYSRGARVISEAGGASVALISEGVGRAPVFIFSTISEVENFLRWLKENEKEIRETAESTTKHGKLIDLQVTVEGHHVFILFLFRTGDAAGQNMVTIATYAAVQWIKRHTPVTPRSVYLESNFSGDKKASALSLHGVRGRKVVAEIHIPNRIVEEILHTTPERMVECGRLGMIGGMLSGTLGAQGHFANGLAALFIACGQDAACVAEAAVGTTSFELDPEGGLYVSVTMPNLIVGTVGGGTKLPSQHACLEIMGLAGSGNARAFAEVAASICLAGEISLVAAISADQFAQAHARLARSAQVAP
ncbi:hydroxymethylglutaryl-CoA reductase [Gammaproteobacteria bacterium]|nr:hydroxymethylglutaryl-CoA reductase [Gammaproteobacteria bacterium]